jgi:general secretion pathway protein D
MFGNSNGSSSSGMFSSGAGSGSGSFGRGGSNSARGGSGARGAPTSTQLGENISVTADPATNSLIIAASKPDYEKIRTLLAQIDIKRRQALVEATLLEVSIDRTIRTSTSFLTSTGGADGGMLAKSEFSAENGLAQLLSAPDRLQGLTLAAASAGSLTLPGGIKIPTQTVLVSAAQQNNNINVLSSPTILATDNEDAQIVVGNTVPFLASTGTNATNLNNTFNQIDRQDVGITLRITPQISSRDYVTLKVYTEVSNLVLSTINSQFGPTTQKRQSETTIIAKDGQMIVTGGLIADDLSETDEGIPYLKDIPVLGHAFKANSTARAQKNLLIFLTPRIIKDQFDARDSTIESRDKLKDVIAHYNVNPRRSTTLDNDRMDRVAESNPYDGPKPGTILPPAKKLKTAPAPQPEAKDDAVVLDGSADGVLDLDGGSAAPAAAPAKKADPSDEAVLDLDDVPAQPEPKASLHLSSAKQANQLSQGAFIVLENANKNRIQSGFPFAGAAPGASVGLIIPSDSPAAARSFFAAGRTYVYSNGTRKLEFRVRRVFPSPSDAESMYPEVSGSWRTLSSNEVAALGKGPWLHKTAK